MVREKLCSLAWSTLNALVSTECPTFFRPKAHKLTNASTFHLQ